MTSFAFDGYGDHFFVWLLEIRELWRGCGFTNIRCSVNFSFRLNWILDWLHKTLISKEFSYEWISNHISFEEAPDHSVLDCMTEITRQDWLDRSGYVLKPLRRRKNFRYSFPRKSSLHPHSCPFPKATQATPCLSDEACPPRVLLHRPQQVNWRSRHPLRASSTKPPAGLSPLTRSRSFHVNVSFNGRYLQTVTNTPESTRRGSNSLRFGQRLFGSTFPITRDQAG